MFFRPKPPPRPRRAPERLAAVVREHLGDADEPTARVVTAIAGLLASVAYEDRVYTEAEERHVRAELSRIHGLPEHGVDAICAVLREHVAELASLGHQRWTRDLRETSHREQRYEVLEVLVDLAAVEGQLSLGATNHLRRLTDALGLDQRDYTAAQARHRDKLGVLGTDPD